MKTYAGNDFDGKTVKSIDYDTKSTGRIVLSCITFTDDTKLSIDSEGEPLDAGEI